MQRRDLVYLALTILVFIFCGFLVPYLLFLIPQLSPEATILDVAFCTVLIVSASMGIYFLPNAFNGTINTELRNEGVSDLERGIQGRNSLQEDNTEEHVNQDTNGRQVRIFGSEENPSQGHPFFGAENELAASTNTEDLIQERDPSGSESATPSPQLT